MIWRQYECELGSPNAPLGFSLTKTNGGFAEVSRVTPGGAAERANVLVGSFVVGLNDRNTSAFDEVVHLVRTLSKPIRFQFAFRPSVFAKRQISTISSVPEPVSVDVSLTFEDVELGCSFEADELGCVVSRVDKGALCSIKAKDFSDCTNTDVVIVLQIMQMVLQRKWAS